MVFSNFFCFSVTFFIGFLQKPDIYACFVGKIEPQGITLALKF